MNDGGAVPRVRPGSSDRLYRPLAHGSPLGPGRSVVRVTDAYVCRLLPLTCLAPDIMGAILDGRQPKGLRLAEMLGNGPLAWNAQWETWGFSN